MYFSPRTQHYSFLPFLRVSSVLCCRQLSHQASPTLHCQGRQAKGKLCTQESPELPRQLPALSPKCSYSSETAAPRHRWRMGFVLCTHPQLLPTRCAAPASTPAPQKWAFSQEFAALKKKKKAASGQKPPETPGGEAAAAPAAAGKNEDLGFVMKRSRHWGNVWKPLGFKATQ